MRLLLDVMDWCRCGRKSKGRGQAQSLVELLQELLILHIEDNVLDVFWGDAWDESAVVDRHYEGGLARRRLSFGQTVDRFVGRQAAPYLLDLAGCEAVQGACQGVQAPLGLYRPFAMSGSQSTPPHAMSALTTYSICLSCQWRRHHGQLWRRNRVPLT